MAPVDLVASTVLALAGLRGFFHGLVREVFSLAGLAAALLAARAFAAPLAAWAVHQSGWEVPPLVARGVAMALIAAAAITALALAGRWVRRGVRAAGLGLADRFGGTLLGAAEGALVCALLLAVATALLGRDHSLLAGSRALAVWEEAERALQRDPPPAARSAHEAVRSSR